MPARRAPGPRQYGAARSSRYAGPALLLIAFAGIALSQLLGPGATEAPLGRHDNPRTPPWFVHAQVSPWLVTTLLAIATLAGAAAVWLGLSGRWRPDPRRAIAAGVLATAVFALLPPVGSADPLSYAADGRIAALGHNPWKETPAQLAATGDPVGQAVEVPWKTTPSVYGPIATGEQALASKVAGTDVALTVLLLDLVGGLVFIAVALLLHWSATDDTGRRRAAVLWAANPLLWLQLVAGAHLDVLAALAALGAVLAAARSRLAAGALAGAAAAIKAPIGLVGVALLWAGRRSRRALIELAVGAVVVGGSSYLIAGPQALHQLSRASRQVSLATPWRPLADVLDQLIGHGASRRLIDILALVLFACLIKVLVRSHPEIRSGSPSALAFALVTAYVLSAPYALPWYDAVPWVLLPLLAASRLDVTLLAHTSILTLAYIPGRAAFRLTGALHTLAFGMRDAVAPVLLLFVLVALTIASRRHASRPAVLA